MPTDITVLHVDDDPDFVEMAAQFIERASDSISVTTATGVEMAIQRLREQQFDCVVSDYDMPGKDGLELLRVVRDEHGDLPFILFTGRGSEEVAGEAIAAGVTGYLQKETNTSQYEVLSNRIENAVAQYRAERAVETTERRYQQLIEESTDAIMVIAPDSTIKYISPVAERITGYTPAELTGDIGFEYIYPDDRETVMTQVSKLASDPDARASAEFRFCRADGSLAWLEARGRNLLDDATIEGLVVYVRDIGERKRREQQLSKLLETTRGLILDDTTDAITQRAVTAGEEILDLDITGLYLVTESGVLEAAAATDRARDIFGTLPTFPPDEDSIAQTVFTTGEAVFTDDVRTHDNVYDSETKVRSEMVLPLGDRGVFMAASVEQNHFDEEDRMFAQLLLSNVEAALARAD